MVKLTAAVAASALLVGCAGYQVGDVTSSVIEKQARYCEATDPEVRNLRRALLERLGLDVPDEGACTNLAEAVRD